MYRRSALPAPVVCDRCGGRLLTFGNGTRVCLDCPSQAVSLGLSDTPAGPVDPSNDFGVIADEFHGRRP